jgi:two-component system phosphate regulon sensor histidine kinase PhoR
MIESLDDGIITINEDRIITHCNQQAASLLAWNPTRARQKRLSAIMDKKTAAVLDSMASKSMTTRTNQERELDLLSSSAQSPTPVRVTMVPLASTPPGPKETMMILTDLSLRREVAELRHIDQMKSNFMSMVSHELRTPLTAITGALHLLQENPPGELSSTQHQLMEIIQNNTNRLTTLVNNLLDVTQIENQTFSIQRTPTDLQEMVKSAVAPFREIARRKGIKLSVRYARSVPTLSLDDKRIRQVIHNLLDNAVKFTPVNGRIMVETAVANNKVCIRVKDSGIGIDKSHKERVFQKFYQADNSISRQWGGAGLGLYIAKAVVTMHDGDIELVDSSSKGTEFLITLPVTR